MKQVDLNFLMVNIITDSTSDLGADIAAEFKLSVIPSSIAI
jgi:fatty acid-binding protein DegV